MTDIIAERTIGYTVISGAVHGLVDRVAREGDKYIATHALQPGSTALWAEEYESKAEALAKLGLEDGESTRMLASPWDAVFVHGVTGREMEEQTLSPGYLVRDLTTSFNEEAGCDEYTALVSSDGGSTWYRYRSFTAPFVR